MRPISLGADGALKVAAGGLLAFGRFPRLSALAFAGTLVPTTIAGHAFWKESDREAQAAASALHQEREHGGLLIAAVETEGKPSLASRGRRAPDAVKHAAADLRRDVLGTTASAVRERLAGEVVRTGAFVRTLDRYLLCNPGPYEERPHHYARAPSSATTAMAARVIRIPNVSSVRDQIRLRRAALPFLRQR